MNDGLNYCDIRSCESIFNACCCLNNFMLDQIKRSRVRVGRGSPMGNDGIWLGRETVLTEVTDLTLSLHFCKEMLVIGKVSLRFT